MFKVRYYPTEKPFFAFDSADVPAEHYLYYNLDTKMGDFLDKMLQPSNITAVLVCSDIKACSVCIEYECDDITIRLMPAFTPIENDREDRNDGDDCPF